MTPAASDLQPAVTHLFEAGKYAAFIWPAYAVSALGFVWMILDTLAQARRWRRKAERLESGDAG